MSNVLEMQNISKTFPGVKALNNISFSIKRGEVRALMGENGAGKSTLIKILSGVYQKDSGNIIFDGKEIDPKSVLESAREGISAIYQELNLIPYLSISENIFAGFYPVKNGMIQWREMEERAAKMFADIKVDVDIKNAELSSMSTAVQQMVAIVRAINMMDAKLIIMDEPTSSLDAAETKSLFEIIRDLKKKNISVIFITHRLDEVFEICDTVTVLKDGEYVGTRNVKDINKYELVKMMIGHEVAEERKTAINTIRDSKSYLCELRNIAWNPKLSNINFSIRKGEILGLGGLLGSGRSECAQILFGCNIPDSGEVFYEGNRISLKSPVGAVKRKMAFCTESRRTEGIIPNMSVEENICIANLSEFSNKIGWTKRKKTRSETERFVKEFSIKTPSIKQLVKNLSGGNQQKVLLARWLCMNPKLIILDEPTRGIDVAAKAEIEKMIREFAGRGISILMISSELPELVRNCDRIIIIYEGKTIKELSGNDMSEERIMQTITKFHEEEQEVEMR